MHRGRWSGATPSEILRLAAVEIDAGRDEFICIATAKVDERKNRLPYHEINSFWSDLIMPYVYDYDDGAVAAYCRTEDLQRTRADDNAARVLACLWLALVLEEGGY